MVCVSPSETISLSQVFEVLILINPPCFYSHSYQCCAFHAIFSSPILSFLVFQEAFF